MAQPSSLKKSVRFADVAWRSWGEVYVSSGVQARACPEVRVTQQAHAAARSLLHSALAMLLALLRTQLLLQPSGFFPSPHLYSTTQSSTFTLALKIEAVFTALLSVHA